MQSAQLAAFILLVVVSNCQTAMTGGWQDIDVNDAEVQQLAGKAVTKLNQESNSAYHQLLVKVHSAKSQVVAGIKYELKLLVGVSNCTKNEADPQSVGDCQEPDENNRKIYTVEIWSKPWENFTEITFKDDGVKA